MKAKHTWRITVIALVTLLGLIGAVYEAYPAGHWSIMARYWKKNVPIVFYGKIVDQQGKPLSGALVTVCIEYFDVKTAFNTNGDHFAIHKIRSTTNVDGIFSVAGERGDALGILDVSLAGFISIPEKEWNYEHYAKYLGFTYASDSGNPTYFPARDKPAVFPLRKPGEPRTLLPSKGGSERIMK